MRQTQWQSTQNGTRHQLNKLGEHSQFIREQRGSAIGFSSDVTNAGPPLCAQGCRSIEIIIVMWPFISQPAPSSFILFYSQHGDLTGGREGVEKGHGSDCIFYSQFVLQSFVQTVFMALDDLTTVLKRQTSIHFFSLHSFLMVSGTCLRSFLKSWICPTADAYHSG